MIEIVEPNELIALLRRRLSKARFDHSIRVARTAVRLARIHGADSRKAWLAGILHDYARELSLGEVLSLARRHGILSQSQDSSIALLHAPLGAILVRDEVGIRDEEVLRAIACHTTGCRGMSVLDKVVYLADVIEPGRSFPALEKLRSLALVDLDGALRLAVDLTVSYVLSRGLPLDTRTMEFKSELEGEDAVGSEGAGAGCGTGCRG